MLLRHGTGKGGGGGAVVAHVEYLRELDGGEATRDGVAQDGEADQVAAVRTCARVEKVSVSGFGGVRGRVWGRKAWTYPTRKWEASWR